MVPIRQHLVNANNYANKCPYSMTPMYITVHNTANDAPAWNEINYMINNAQEVSYHYAVDDKEAVQGVPENRNTWNAGDGSGNGNMRSIAIEICYSLSGGDRFIQAEKNGAQLVAYLLKKYGWGIERVKKHQDWNGKYCPHRTLDMGWTRFLNMVKSYMGDTSTPSTKPVKAIVPTIKAEVKKDKSGYITDIMLKATGGSLKYRVHEYKRGWLPWVTGSDWNDPDNGYAGDGRVLDAITVYLETDTDQTGGEYYKACYKVNDYPHQYDDEVDDNQDGYAGEFGVKMKSFTINTVKA